MYVYIHTQTHWDKQYTKKSHNYTLYANIFVVLCLLLFVIVQLQTNDEKKNERDEQFKMAKTQLIFSSCLSIHVECLVWA